MKAKIVKTEGLYVVFHHVMTATGPAEKSKQFARYDDAAAFADKIKSSSMPTNGYELHTAADA